MDDFLEAFRHDECETVVLPIGAGLRELREMAQQGTVRLGNRAVVVVFIGHADVVRGRRFSPVLERFIDAAKTLAPDTYVVMLGPFPGPLDGPHILERLFTERHYTQERLLPERWFRFLEIGDRFANLHQINPRLMGPEGLTIRGCEILERDVGLVLQELPYAR